MTGGMRRSPLTRQLTAAGAAFEPLGDTDIAMAFADNDEADVLARLALVDLSPLPRTGFKGPRTTAWLSEQGIAMPERPNLMRRQADGTRVLRLGLQEHLILPPPSGDAATVDGLAAACDPDATPGVYLLPRRDSHAWLRVTGLDAPGLFAKLCAVDLSTDAFPDLAVAQTMLAGITAIVARDDLPDLPAFHLLFDSASADYLWDCLLDAGEAFAIAPVGFRALAAQAGM